MNMGLWFRTRVPRRILILLLQIVGAVTVGYLLFRLWEFVAFEWFWKYW